MADPTEQEPVGFRNVVPATDDTIGSTDSSAPPSEEPGAAVLSGDSAAQDESPTAGGSSNVVAADSESEPDATPVDDLPDWEPLTPEIVEDEAIRGDFMLRWAVVLLAFLLGCREISDTVTLVRIRTGEYLAANGVFPPATDVFSYTAAERPWVNLAWLFDLTIAGLHGVGGATALSLFTALAAGATFYILNGITRQDAPTWWTSVCAGVALLVTHLQFTALPQVVTLLGTAWVVHSLYAWSQTGKRSTLWCLVVSLAVWSNLDPRAFIGWLILLAWLVGTSVGQKFGRGGDHANASLKDLTIAAGAGLVALMVHPFGWHTILSPFQLYGVEIPALAKYAGRISLPEEIQLVSLFDSAVWNNLNQHTIAALLIAVMAVATSIMNAARVNVGLFLAFVVTLGLSVLCSHELGAATLIACVLASLNGQSWYQAHCRQEYSIDTFEVLWSRVGRAITVLGFATVAFLAISGRLMGPEGRRVGLGFSPWFAKMLDGTASELEATGEARIFTFRLDQSDILLWHGVPTFVDSRVGVFSGGAGSDDILRIHNQTRFALRGSSKSTPVADPSNADSTAATGESSQDDWIEKRDLWQTTFQSFQVELVTPRMWGASPDYSSYLDLTASDDWNLVALGATTAFFRRADSVASEDVPSTPKPGLFRKLAFDDCRANSDVPARLEWPRPPSGYQRFLSLPERPSSSLGFRAQHELAHLSAAARGLLSMNQEDAMGLASLALRDAVAGVGEEPDNPNTFRILADIHGVLDGIESGIMSQYQLQVPTQQRFYQRLLAYRQSLTVAPDDVDVLSSLADLYFSSGRGDLALEMIDRALAVFRDQSEFDDHTLQLARRLNQVKQQLAPQIETVEGRIKEAMLQDNFDPIQLAAALHQAGFSGHALKLLEEDRLMVSGNPSAELQLAMLLVEAGRFEEASTLFAAFEQMSTDSAIPLPIVLQACWLDMALGNYPAAMSRCSKRIDQVQQASTQAMLATLPFSMPTPQFLGESNIWPASQTLVASRTLIDTASEVALLQWTLAMASIEAGKCAEASAALRDLLAGFPESQFRPLARAWLKALTGEEIAAIPPGPEPGIMFHDDSDMSDAPEPPAAETGQP